MSDTPSHDELQHGHGRDYAAAIYGSIVATALIGALGEADVSARDITLSVLTTMIVFWLAHTWAAVAGERIHRRHRLSWHRVRALGSEEWPMVEAGFGPLAALLLGWIGLTSDETAATLAVAIGVIQLFAWGLFLGHRVYGTWLGGALAGLGNGILGLVLVLLEAAVLH
jgi:hypothetical protein